MSSPVEARWSIYTLVITGLGNDLTQINHLKQNIIPDSESSSIGPYVQQNISEHSDVFISFATQNYDWKIINCTKHKS